MGAALIAGKNQALLNGLKAERDAKIAKAREIIATHQ